MTKMAGTQPLQSICRVMGVRKLVCAFALAAACGLTAASSALGDAWFPHPANGQWQYRWTDSAYNPGGTVENVVVQQQAGIGFTLAWADSGETPPAAGSSPTCSQNSDLGTMSFQDANSGLLNTDWQSCPPPSSEPILCPSASNCANSLASALFNVIWGSRAPVLAEPLLRNTSWTSTGGADSSVTSNSQYLGQQLVKVPAFPNGVVAAVVRSQINQAGALGDPYGSGLRTTWWAYGVGPVRVVFDHAGGSSAPVTDVELQSTNLAPAPPPPDQDYFPLKLGLKGTYRWTNNRHMRQPEVEQVSIDAVVNRSARISVKSRSGPMRAAGQYIFHARLDGLTNSFGSSAAASLVRWPSLGHKRHFFTPYDLMTYGFNPVLPAYPVIGTAWKSGNPVDLHVFGVFGTTTVVGVQTVHVPAGTFRALVVRSVLTQPGHRFGSGTRTMWFAPARGLVKLVFRHRDGSVSLVQLIK
jgi:hypothetical protein